MSIDIVGNMLASIKNAYSVKKRFVAIPHSKFKESILEVLQKNGYIKGFEEVSDAESFGKKIKIMLKYVNGESVIHQLTRVSSPGLRIYKKPNELRPIINGLGISVLSTSSGVMSDVNARKLNIGGELLLTLW